MLGNMDLFLVAVGEVLDRCTDDPLGDHHRLALFELHVRGEGELGLGTGGDELGVVLLRDLDQGRHDALHVHDHGLDGAGGERQLLLEEVSRQRDAVPHEDLICRAADPA